MASHTLDATRSGGKLGTYMLKTLVGLSGIAMLLTVAAGCSMTPLLNTYQQTKDPTTEALHFQWQSPTDPYLAELRARYELDKVVAAAHSDYEKAVAITHWTHQRWSHSVSHEGALNDPLSILDAAAHGEQFRCTEYAIVVAGAMSALGVPSRVLFIQSNNAFKKLIGTNGHVVAEAYLRDQDRWVLLDGQWDAVPWVNGHPANALELHQAIQAGSTDIQIVSLSGTSPHDFLPWIAGYLQMFTVRLDNRFGPTPHAPGFLRLVPEGTTEDDPRFPYTHSTTSFYQAPRIV